MMYTVWAVVVAAVAVARGAGVGPDRAVPPPGVLGDPRASPGGSRCSVDGWLTKLSAPIVIYNPTEFLGVRWPWDIPVEDFVYGFALMTLVLVTWVRLTGTQGTVER